MKLFKLLLLSIACFISFESLAQNFSSQNKKAIKKHKEAKYQFENNNIEEALEYNNKALKADPDFIEAHMLQAYIFVQKNEIEKAILSFEHAVRLNPGFFPGNLLQLGILYFKTQQYKKCQNILTAYIKRYKPKGKQMYKASFHLLSAAFSQKAIANPVPFTPENLGPSINTELREYNPILDVPQSKLIFTKTIPDANLPSGAREDLYVTYSKNSQWSKAYSLGAPLNSELREGAPSLTPDGKTMILTVCESFGNYGRGRNGLGSCDIFVSMLKGQGWTNPRNLGKKVNTPHFDSQASISSNGNMIYFSSNRPGGNGGSDIYVTEIKNGAFTMPKNLGHVINTPGNEEGVFIHPDNQTLYFTSTGHPGLGGSDIFMSKRQEDGTWGKPTNLGYPINTHESEWGLSIDATGQFAYFASDRAGGYGDMDIYKFPMPKEIQPLPVTYLKGMVFNKNNQAPLDAKFELIDLQTKKQVYSSYSDYTSGEFFVCLPAGKDYLLNVSKDGFLFHSENFTLTKSENMEPFKKDIPLNPIVKGVPVVLKNIFFDTDKFDLKTESTSELDILVKFLTNNPSLKIEIGGHTDNRGNKQHNATLSNNRAKSVMNYLIDKGIATTRLSAKGYGDASPIDDNNTVAGRANNRRTEFIIVE